MNSNRCSCERGDQPTGSPPDRVAALAADLDGLATQDVDGLSDAALAEQALQLRQQVDRLEGQWLQRLAAVDARGAAGADHGTQAPSTASWLRGRPHLGASTATSAVRTAQALSAGPSPKRPRPYAPASSRPPTPARWPTAPVTSPTTPRSRPSRCWRPRPTGWTTPATTGHRPPTPGGRPRRRRLRQRAAPRATRPVAGPHLRGHGRPPRPARPRSRPDPAGRLAPWPARPTTLAAATSAAPTPDRAGPPPPGGRSAAPDRRVRPQLTVIVDLDSLLGHQPVLGGEAGWAGPLAPEARPAAGL